MKHLPHSFYDFSATNVYGSKISFDKFRNHVVLIVNTAFECNFASQLKELEILHQIFENENFSILAFPSDNFGSSETQMREDILNFCIRNLKISFDLFSKIDVTGETSHPLYQFLSDKSLNGQFSSSPLWNFHKYLIDKNGVVVDYYYTFTKPTSKRIWECLATPETK